VKHFSDKIVVITGAGSGIGRATALAFADAGATLELLDIREDRLQRVAGEVRRRGRPAAVHGLDCADAVAVERAAAAIFEAHGRVDVLQNGVGLLVAVALEQVTREQWRQAIDVNLWSLINSVQAFIPRMLAQGSPSHVVNVASMSGLMGFPYTAPYTTTKFAVVGLSESMTAELYGKGIRVTTVCPGAVRTNLVNDGLLRLPGGWDARIRQTIERFSMEPEALAATILRAVRHDTPMVVPTAFVNQLWLFKRLADRPFRELSRRLFGLAARAG